MIDNFFSSSAFPWFFVGVILFLVIWSVAWKGLALWRAARRGEMAWFVILLIFNTLGILEIIYIFIVSNQPSALATKKDHVEPIKTE